MYNETHDDETYDDYVTWEDDRLQHPNLVDEIIENFNLWTINL